MKIQILPATETDFPIVQNLVRFYVYDMSETMGWASPEDGLYGGCDDLPEYWWTGSTPEDLEAIRKKLEIVIPFNLHFDRWPDGYRGHPFMIRVDGELAGFALVKKMHLDGQAVYDMGEFFVVRKFRRLGVGRTAAHTVFDRFPGAWQVRQMLDHRPAQDFWRQVIMAYSGNQYKESTYHDETYDIEMVMQEFTSPGGFPDKNPPGPPRTHTPQAL